MSQHFTLICINNRQDDKHLHISTFKYSWCVLRQVIMLNLNLVFIEEAAHKDNH